MRESMILLLFAFTMSCSTKGHNSQTELQAAVFSGNTAEIELALAHGAGINQPIGCNDYRVLEAAILKNDFELFRFLLSKGAKPNQRCIFAARKSSNPQFIAKLDENPLEK